MEYWDDEQTVWRDDIAYFIVENFACRQVSNIRRTKA